MSSPKLPATMDNDQDVDESGLEKDPNRGPEIEVPFDPSKIDIIAKPMTISSLRDRLENDELDLTPEFHEMNLPVFVLQIFRKNG